MEGTFYCLKEGDVYSDFFRSIVSVKMCGDVTVENFRKVRVYHDTEVTDKLKGYWAWYDFEKEGMSLIFRSYNVLTICDPFGFRYDIEEGRGVIIGVSIEELELTEDELQRI